MDISLQETVQQNTRHNNFKALILNSVIRALNQTPQNKRSTKISNLTNIDIAKRSFLSTTSPFSYLWTLIIKNKHFKGSYLAASTTVYKLSVNKASNLFQKLHLTTHTFRNYLPAQAGIIPYHHIDSGALHRLVTNSTLAVVNRQKTKMPQTKSWLPNR